MARLNNKLILLSVLSIMISSGACPLSAAEIQSVKDSRYEVFMTNPPPGLNATTITFRSDNILIIEAMDGTGVYFPAGNAFTAVYWAPDFYLGNDITLYLTGFVLNPFIFAFGKARVGDDTDFILITGYSLTP